MVMDTLLSCLMTQTYELEGLLLVVEKHGADTPQVVYQRITELGEQIAAHTAQLLPSQPELQAKPAEPELPTEPAEPEQPAEPAEPVQPAKPAEPEQPTEPAEPEQPAEHVQPVAQRTSEPREQLPEQDYDADETWQHDNGEEFTEVFKVDYVEPQPVVKPQPNVVLVEPHDEPAAIDTAEPLDEDLRVDEKLHRSLSKDMHKALSLNDRFRFQRELFSNSKNDLNNALDLINAMQSFDEAQEYFIGDLGWDQDNEDVADFMGLVRRHFL